MAAVEGKEITEINRAPSQPKTDFFGKILYAFLVEGKILNIRRMSRSKCFACAPSLRCPLFRCNKNICSVSPSQIEQIKGTFEGNFLIPEMKDIVKLN